jgi:hypothetical protein
LTQAKKQHENIRLGTDDMTNSGTSWPPAPEGQNPLPVPDDDAEEALHHGWRLLFLGLCCAPPVFLPLAAWQGITANRRRSGAGTLLLLSVCGVSVFWLGAFLLLAYFDKGT